MMPLLTLYKPSIIMWIQGQFVVATVLFLVMFSSSFRIAYLTVLQIPLNKQF